MFENSYLNVVLEQLQASRRVGKARIRATWCEVCPEREVSAVKARWEGPGYSVDTSEIWVTRWFLEDNGII